MNYRITKYLIPQSGEIAKEKFLYKVWRMHIGGYFISDVYYTTQVLTLSQEEREPLGLKTFEELIELDGPFGIRDENGKMRRYKKIHGLFRLMKELVPRMI
jgi:hypothetical protein